MRFEPEDTLDWGKRTHSSTARTFHQIDATVGKSLGIDTNHTREREARLFWATLPVLSPFPPFPLCSAHAARCFPRQQASRRLFHSHPVHLAGSDPLGGVLPTGCATR